MNQNFKHIFVVRPDTLTCLISQFKGKWPYTDRYKHTIKKILEGEEILIYVTRHSAFAGTLEVTGVPIRTNETFILNKEFYQYYLPVKFKTLLEDEDDYISIKPYLNTLTLTKGKKNWGSALQKAVVKINEKDFDIMKCEIHKQLPHHYALC